MKSRLVRTWQSLRMFPERRLLRRRLSHPVIETIAGHTVVVLPEVFNPVAFRSGACLAEFLHDSPEAAPGGEDSCALDLGTGSGIQALVLASRGHRVDAVDLNTEAVRCARANAILNGLEHRIEVHHGDLFAPVGAKRFDLIVFNPPFFRGEPKGRFDLSWRSLDVLPRFAQGLAGHLNPGGRAIVIWSSHEPEQSLLGPLSGAGLATRVLARRQVPIETMTLFQVTRGA